MLEKALLKLVQSHMEAVDVGTNFLSGAGGGVLNSLFHVDDLMRRVTGQQRIIDRPEIQKLIESRPGFAEGAGRMLEQGAEFAIPAGRVAKAVEKASLLARMAAEGLTSGGVAALQTGGEPGSVALATGLGAVGPAVTKGLQALARPVAPAAEAGAVATRGAPVISARSGELTPADVQAVDFAKREAIPVPASIVTGNRFAKAAEQMGGSTLLGSGIAHRAQNKTAEAMSLSAARLAERAHGTPAVPETAGAALTKRLEDKIHGLKQEADGAYAEFRTAAEDPRNVESVQVGTQELKTRDVAGNPIVKPVLEQIAAPVDVRGLKAQLKPVLEGMSWMPAADRASSAGYTAVKKIIEGPDVISAVSAEQGLSGLKTMAREAVSSDLRNESQGLAAGIIPELQGNIDAAAQKAGVLTQLTSGRNAHALKMEAADVLGQLRTEPVQAFNQATYAHDSGIDMLRSLRQWAPMEMQKVGRGYLQNLFDTAQQEGGFARGQSIWSKWQNLGPETKKILYPNALLRRDLDSFFLLGKKLSTVANPSGTAATQHALGQLGMTVIEPTTGITYILGTAAMTKLLYSPSGIRLLSRAMEASVKPPSRVLASPITALLERAGDGAQPVDSGKEALK
jgi:hypothetical protein